MLPTTRVRPARSCTNEDRSIASAERDAGAPARRSAPAMVSASPRSVPAFIGCGSYSPRGGSAEQPLRPHHQHEDEERERDRVLELPAILERRIHSGDADEGSAEQRAEIAAEPADDRRDEAVQHIRDAGIVGYRDHRGGDEAGGPDDQPADREGEDLQAADPDAGGAGGVEVLRDGADRKPAQGARVEPAERQIPEQRQPDQD